jgi:ribosomal protein S18 acetylase RimI-like enzyme
MTTTTRSATFDDIPILVELMQEFYAEANYQLDRQWAAASFSALLKDNSRGAAWVILQDSEPAGYVVLTIRFSMEYGGLDGFIDDLFIRPAYRRQGLGRAALKALFDECGRRKLLAVHVEVGQDDVGAKSLYRSYGLEPKLDGRQALTARLSNGPVDA